MRDRTGRTVIRSTGRHAGLAGVRAGWPGQRPGIVDLLDVAHNFNHKIIQKLIYLYIYYNNVEWNMCIVVCDTLKAGGL
jgi:histidinol-phosphate/aromatic aminotransferase/cobyric acid decarboxylase-like protein